MDVVVAKEDAEKFLELAKTENLEATAVAEVTDTNRLTTVSYTHLDVYKRQEIHLCVSKSTLR